MPDRDSLQIRVATTDDAAAIAEIYNQSIVAGDATMDEEPKSEAAIAGLIEGFDERELILILESRSVPTSKPLGWGIIKKYSDRTGYRFCCETSVYLRRDLVGRGHGSHIKSALIEKCRELGYHHLVAKIFAGNRRSIEYNLRFGYELVGIQKEIGFKNGQWQDVAILQLVLSDDESADRSSQ